MSEANKVAHDVSGANLRDVSLEQGGAAVEEELARAHADLVQVVSDKRELQNELFSIRKDIQFKPAMQMGVRFFVSQRLRG